MSIENLLVIIAAVFFIGVAVSVSLSAFKIIRVKSVPKVAEVVAPPAEPIKPKGGGDVIEPAKSKDTKPAGENHLAIAADVLKWFIGTVVIGLFGTITANEFKKTELELKRMETDAKLIEAVSAKFDTATAIQYKYLYYIQPFITTDSLKKGVAEKLDILRADLKKVTAVQVVAISKENLPRKKLTRDDTTKLQRLTKNTGRKNKEQLSISVLKTAENTAARDIFKVPLDTLMTQKLNNVQQFVAPIVENSFSLQGPPETHWAKAGYFVQYNNDLLRLGVNDVDPGSVELRISTVNSNNVAEIIEDEFKIALGSSRTVDDKKTGFRYTISLDFVGSAGRNPFTKAAYLTVSTYRQTTR